MKFFPIHIMIYALLALLPACELIHDDLPETKAEGAPVYIRLTISTGEMGETRATPNGGEEGDGWQEGTESENAVNDVTLFFFAENLNTGYADDPVVSLSFNKSELFGPGNGSDRVDKYYYTVTKEVKGLTANDYNVLAVVNTNGAFNGITTLGELRDKKVENTTVWNDDNFMMSSERLSTVEDIQGTSENNPAKVDIYVERLAARVDYRVEYPEGETAFSIDDGTVQILGATLVNDFRKGEYLFKRVGQEADASTYTYLGDETVNNDGNATNWVVDPYNTDDKDEDYYNNYYPTYDPDISDDKDNTTDWVCLGYTLENTNPADAYRDEYTTGVVFKAKFTPKGFSEGASFYYLNGKFYQDIEAIKKDYPTFSSLDENNYESYGITFCKGGICYYTWWILHSNNSDGSDIMRYAIVRNNLYQLTVTSVSAFPAEGDELVIIVAVEEWNSLREVSVPLEKQ